MAVKKGLSVTLLVSAIILIVVVTFFLVVWPMISKNTTELHLGNGVFKALIAADGPSRAKGLSGSPELESDAALMMAYPYDSKWTIIANNDYSYKVDIVWLSADKKVVYFVRNVQHDLESTNSYVPKYPAKYVIELPAGAILDQSIKLNSVAEFKFNSSIGN